MKRLIAVSLTLVLLGLGVLYLAQNGQLDIPGISTPAISAVPMTIDSCTEKGKDRDGIYRVYECHTSFSDDFENGIQFTEEKWHKKNLQTSNGKPGDATSYVEITTERAHSGKHSLKTFSAADRNDIQKSGLIRALLFFPPGSDFWMSAWYFLPSGTETENLFIFELEATRNRYVGRRLVLGNPNGDTLYVSAKRGTGDMFYQLHNPLPFPKDRWVRVRLHMHLSPGDDGLTELWQDDTKVIERSGRNMPNGHFYDWVSIGQTANASHQAQTLFVDDVVVSDQPIP